MPAVATANAYLEPAPRRSPAARNNAKLQTGNPIADRESEEARYMRKPWKREILSLENASGGGGRKKATLLLRAGKPPADLRGGGPGPNAEAGKTRRATPGRKNPPAGSALPLHEVVYVRCQLVGGGGGNPLTTPSTLPSLTTTNKTLWAM